MASAVVGLASIFSDMGLNGAFVQKQDVSERQRSSLFWFSTLVSLAICTLIAVTSGTISIHAFSDDRLALLICMLAPTFVLNALAAPVRVAAEKELQFKGLTIIEILSALAAFFSAVGLALSGHGVYSLVISSIIGSVVSLLLTWRFLSRGWKPALVLKFSDIRPFIGFGGALVATNCVNHVNWTLDIVFGGRIWGANLLGFYSLPRNLVLQVQSTVNPIITNVGFPLIAKIQNDKERVRDIYLQTISMTAAVNAPIYWLIALLAEEIVAILWGDRWSDSGPILQILALWAAARALGNPVGSLTLGTGRADLSLKWNLAMLLLMPPAIWFGATHGPIGLSISMLALTAGMYLPMWKFLVAPLSGVSLSDYLRASLTPVLIALAAAIPVYFLKAGQEFPLGAALSLGLPYVSIYLLLSWFLNRSWLKSILELIRGT